MNLFFILLLFFFKCVGTIETIGRLNRNLNDWPDQSFLLSPVCKGRFVSEENVMSAKLKCCLVVRVFMVAKVFEVLSLL